MDAAAATAELERMVASVEDPVLDGTAVAALLTIAQRPDSAGNLPTNLSAVAVWVASTVYAPGDVRQPDPVDGRWWQCQVGGTSAGSQPDWPDLSGDPRTLTTISDGSVTWVDAGAAWAPTYDLAAAAAEGWNRKAALAAARFQFVTDGQQFHRQQVIAHCHMQADRYRRKQGVSVAVIG